MVPVATPAAVHFDISMSLDGFITGPGEGVGNPLGDDGRLHNWMFAAGRGPAPAPARDRRTGSGDPRT